MNSNIVRPMRIPRIQLRPKDAPTGRVTRDEIDYCRQDVNASVGLLNALLSEFRRYPLGGLPPEKAFSAASIAKAFLNTMGVIQPSQNFQLDDKTNGICMQGYYGGRAEIRIRHTSLPICYVDYISQYPTCNTLLGLWRLLTAKKVRVREETRDVEATCLELRSSIAWPMALASVGEVFGGRFGLKLLAFKKA
jgi:hypothetical protein